MHVSPFAVGIGRWHGEVLAGVAVTGVLYARWWRRHRGPRRYPAAFYSALALLVLCLNGPLHDLSDDYLLSAHMVQHLILTLVVAPLLLLGTPPALADAVLGPVLRRRASAAALRWLTRPLPAFAVYGAVLVVWHLPLPYGAALDAHPIHVLEHVTLIGTALLGWWPILSPSTVLPRLHYAAQLLYLFAFGIPMTVVAAFVTTADEVLYPYYTLAPRLWGLSPLSDQRLAGAIMWVPAAVIPIVAFTVVFFRWVMEEADESA